MDSLNNLIPEHEYSPKHFKMRYIISIIGIFFSIGYLVFLLLSLSKVVTLIPANVIFEKKFILISLLCDFTLFCISIAVLIATYYKEDEVKSYVLSTNETNLNMEILTLLTQLKNFSEKKNFGTMLSVNNSVIGNLANEFNIILSFIVGLLKHIQSESNDIFLKSKRVQQDFEKVNNIQYQLNNRFELMEANKNKIAFITQKEIQTNQSMDHEFVHLSDKIKQILNNVHEKDILVRKDGLDVFKKNTEHVVHLINMATKSSESNTLLPVLNKILITQNTNLDLLEKISGGQKIAIISEIKELISIIQNLKNGMDIIKDNNANKDENFSDLYNKITQCINYLKDSDNYSEQFEKIISDLQENSNTLLHYINTIQLEQ